MPRGNLLCDECSDAFWTEEDLREHKLFFHCDDDEEMAAETRSRPIRYGRREMHPGGRRAAVSRQRKQRVA